MNTDKQTMAQLRQKIDSLTGSADFLCYSEWFEYILRNCHSMKESDDILLCIVECSKGNLSYKPRLNIHAQFIERLKVEFVEINPQIYGN